MTRAARLIERDTAGRRPVVAPRSATPGADLTLMTLARLRSYRRDLLEEELRASYWRRLVQARRDLLRADCRAGDRAAMVAALTEVRGSGTRQALLHLHPEGGLPVLPHLPDLWARPIDGDEASRAHLLLRLASAESVMSTYREALHRRLDRATAELVERYRQDPTACFVALVPPRPRGRR